MAAEINSSANSYPSSIVISGVGVGGGGGGGAAISAATPGEVAVTASPANNMLPKQNKMASLLFGPTVLRKLLPAALCLITFATVMTILLVYMDTTALSHQQFRINMTQDYDMLTVAQDNPLLIAYIRQLHMSGGSLNAQHFGANPEWNLRNDNNATAEPTPAVLLEDKHKTEGDGVLDRITYIANLLNNKKNGVFVESLNPNLAGGSEYLSNALGWSGLLVEPDPRRYFALRKKLAHGSKTKAVHACLSPTPHPREVSIHKEDFNDGVQIRTIDNESDLFNSRVKCFPIFSLLLAINNTSIDLLSISSEGYGLQILSTIPYEKVRISIIDIHLGHTEDLETSQNITKFLASKSYKLMNTFGRIFVYMLNRVKI